MSTINREVNLDITDERTVDESLQGNYCFLCLADPFKIGDSVVKFRCRCSYWAHKECFSRYIGEACPTCRVPLTSLDQKSALLAAASQGDLAKVREMLDQGISHSPRGGFEETALMRAVQEGHREVAVALLDQGASVSDKDIAGATPLHHAVARGQDEMVILLLDRGANISAVDRKRRSPLHYAIDPWPNQKVVQILLDRGAPCSIPDQDCLSPLDLAKKGCHKAIVDLLQNRGAMSGARFMIQWNSNHSGKALAPVPGQD
ncbi:uncharacterized protein Z518_11061 [Rhinocladiella mackenziei CBS 650.93]|uniref:RING-type domain-containing protein n=1 Tax=Rhinocladiella mackenziei CBS 650.93 TaxID=1442369 RepID=A0A0D2I1M9_9EURO|nr:uncharacterized protein Z518_11060 [Rhinocladiella mackenziei CBS 650.93]XP_013266785.1 uncharacterized protein Z518_11061 [Rhinocladiella mackenziei CBS 650.93]KIW99647.1 hypothetical protein Z518_11060 [Rhinocladiella mackenziei CBS 650.93]KIW99648.1 hypothetical protein Z518_11061 [Rhinocladiella mackenziei CBS 650.93]